MSDSRLDRDAVRKLLERVPTDADFDAFCLDFYPTVHARFGNGMERVQKITLLFQLASDTQGIADRLCQRFPNFAVGLVTQTQAQRHHIAWVVGMALLIAVAGFSYWLSRSQHEPVAVPSSVTDPVAQVTDAGAATQQATWTPPGGRTTVQQQGDIRAKGGVKITAPVGSQETLVKTQGQIEAGGDVQIGVTAPVGPVASPRTKKAGP